MYEDGAYWETNDSRITYTHHVLLIENIKIIISSHNCIYCP